MAKAAVNLNDEFNSNGNLKMAYAKVLQSLLEGLAPEKAIENFCKTLEFKDLLVKKTDYDLTRHINTISNGLVDILGICHDEVRVNAKSVILSLLTSYPQHTAYIFKCGLNHEYWKVTEGTLSCLKDFTEKTRLNDSSCYAELIPYVKLHLNSHFNPVCDIALIALTSLNQTHAESCCDRFESISSNNGKKISPVHIALDMPMLPSTNSTTSAYLTDESDCKEFTEKKFRFQFEMVELTKVGNTSNGAEKVERIEHILSKFNHSEKSTALKELQALVEPGEHMVPYLGVLEATLVESIIDPSWAVAMEACKAVILISTYVDHNFPSDSILSSIIGLMYDSCPCFASLGLYTMKHLIANVSSTNIFLSVMKLLSSNQYKMRQIASQLLVFILSNWPVGFLLQHRTEIRTSIEKCKEICRQHLSAISSFPHIPPIDKIDEDVLGTLMEGEFLSFQQHLDYWKDFIPTLQRDGLSSIFSDIERAAQDIRRAERLLHVCFSHVQQFKYETYHKQLFKLWKLYDGGRCLRETALTISTKSGAIHHNLTCLLLKEMDIDANSLSIKSDVQTRPKIFKNYKSGAIVLDNDLRKVLTVETVQGKKGYPKGTLDCYFFGELESQHIGAGREVDEETTHLIHSHIDKRQYIDIEVGQDSVIRMFLIRHELPKIPRRDGELSTDVKE